MPFPMTHLLISHEILSLTDDINNPSDFILGALAPDSVHFRNNYSSEYKLLSHLCVGDEKWGSVTNNDEWKENVFLFLKENRNFKSRDFIYGYCSHIIADIQNNRKLYLPFKKVAKEKKEENEMSKYHQESSSVDFELYIDKRIPQMISLLNESEHYELKNLIYEDELKKLKRHIIFKQYSNVSSKDLSANKYVTLDRIISFIKEESIYIKELIFI